ncbi:MAG: dethiobiotin synthase [Alphaproteobacteria bacterium]|jgi:dethiobiotin synthetase
MRRIFITATGTEVGKTYIGSKLIENLIKDGKKIEVYKPIISGFVDRDYNDLRLLLKSWGKDYTQETISKMARYIFAEPLSPDIVARRHKKTISTKEVVKFCTAKTIADFQIIEGAGGVMTPINHNQTMLDLIKELQSEVILVSNNYLGMLSHTLTSLNALKASKIKVLAIIINKISVNDLKIEELIESLKNFYKGEIIVVEKNGNLALNLKANLG